MKMRKISCIVSFVALMLAGVCGNLRAQQYIRLPKPAEKLLRANPDIFIFQIDVAKIPRQMAKESEEKYQKRWAAFIQTQRKSSRPLTDFEKQQLLQILLDPGNYEQGGFCDEEITPVGMDIRGKNDSAVFICGDGIICTYQNRNRQNALLNEAGFRAFKQWRGDVIEASKASGMFPPMGDVPIVWRNGVLVSATGLPAGTEIKDPVTGKVYIVGGDGKATPANPSAK